MIDVEIDYVDKRFTVIEPEPATLEELVNLYGSDAVRTEAIDNWRYRSKYDRVYKKVSEAIITEFPKQVKSEKKLSDGTTKKVYISVLDHIRAFADTTPEAAAKVQSLLDTIAPAEPLYIKGERGGNSRVAKVVVEAANIFFAQGDEVVDAKVAMIEQMVPGYKVGRDVEGSVTVESLARGIQAVTKHLQQQAKTALGT